VVHEAFLSPLAFRYQIDVQTLLLKKLFELKQRFVLIYCWN